MTSKIKLIIVNNALDYSQDNSKCLTKHGDSLFDLIESVYEKGLPLNTFLYHQKWHIDNDVTPQVPSDIDKINELEGRFYLVTYPSAASTLIMIAISVAGAIAVAFLMPVPEAPAAGGTQQPPSPNNSLSRRTNKQRLGGRVPDIFGEVWSVPDLIAPTYRAYIDNKEVEFSYMCVGRGKYNVTKALDDTTPFNQVAGSSLMVFDPDTTLNDTPAFEFGSSFTSDEAAWSRYATKRYTAVNGQELPAPNGYLKVKLAFNNPNTISTTDTDVDFTTRFKNGDNILIEGASGLPSANGIKDANNNDVIYDLSGQYVVASVNKNTITLNNPAEINNEWQQLIDNVDYTNSDKEITLSSNKKTLWQGWYYTNSKEHDGVFVNVVAPNGLYENGRNPDWRGLVLYGQIESEIVDVNDNPIAGTLHVQDFEISSPNIENEEIRGYRIEERSKWVNDSENGWDVQITEVLHPLSFAYTQRWLTDNAVRGSAGVSIRVENPHMGKGKRIRWRIARTSKRLTASGVSQDIKIKDFYGYSTITNNAMPKGYTTVYAKQTATEGALALKERKVKLLVERYVRDWRNNDKLILSKRIDDIIYHLATDKDVGRLDKKQLNMAQITAELDAQIEYFGTDLCAQFCGTFDKNDITLEETIQTVAQAAMMRAYRLNNQINVHFERPVSAPVATFNSRNMLPDSYDYNESFGTVDDKDGVKLTYTDPADDTPTVLHYPADESAVNPRTVELTGVRNKVQAHMHLMRQYNKDQHAYKSCSFTGADESGVVIPTNVVQVANQTHADTQQGAVEELTVNDNGQPVLITDEPIDFGGNETGTIFVQTIAKTVDGIQVTKVDNDYQLLLSRPPTAPISTDSINVVRASYQFVTHDDAERDLYIVSTKSPGENALSNELECVNYDSRYYQNDKDYIQKLITA